MVRDNDCSRTIVDVWEAVRITAKVASVLLLITTGVVAVCLVLFGATHVALIAVVSSAFLLGEIYFLYLVWRGYTKGIVIDPQNDSIGFPYSDVELTVGEIFFLKPFLGLSEREELRLSQIESVMNDTKRTNQNSWPIRDSRFAINITGPFGSRQLTFSSKQKRDEFRAHIIWASKQINHHISISGNFDSPIGY